jgi:predicted O-methyltransferase YrrM
LVNHALPGLGEADEPGEPQLQEALHRKERVIQALLTEHTRGRFLEIGIGAFPVLERMRLIVANAISYTGCDFQRVCEAHRLELTMMGLDLSRIRFACNKVGTYAWTLFEMLERGERFDFIYLDGHHTFYVDLPAFQLAHQLLEPGGHIMVDDIQWTLLLLKRNMARRFSTWCYYKDMYDFADYTPAQAAQPHLKKIAEGFLVGAFQYRLSDEHSTEWWWVLRKPLRTPV